MFTEQQNKELAAKLDGGVVAKRKQGNFMVSYIEGWWVISEANRIFGFGNWDRQTVELEVVHESGYVNAKGVDMWAVSYRAKVRIIVHEDGGDRAIMREGSGTGHGYSKPASAGDAHESALKEAETDAMKRALMTFGNPFGLALYDKKRANVAQGNVVKAKEAYRTFVSDLTACDDESSLDGLLNAPRTKKLLERFEAVIPEWTDELDETISKQRAKVIE